MRPISSNVFTKKNEDEAVKSNPLQRLSPEDRFPLVGNKKVNEATTVIIMKLQLTNILSSSLVDGDKKRCGQENFEDAMNKRPRRVKRNHRYCKTIQNQLHNVKVPLIIGSES
jgi:hypothetical protein